MAGRSDASMAALLLSQRLVDVEAAPLKASEYWPVLAAVADAGRLLDLSAEEIAAEAGVDAALARRIAARMAAATTFAFRLDDAQQAGIHLVASVDEEYPPVLAERLGAGAPPLLYVVGDLMLLQAPTRTVVAFEATGTPRDTGGAACAVLAGSLLRATKDPQIRRAVAAGTMCLCSPYPPGAVATAATEKGRDRIVEALSVS